MLVRQIIQKETGMSRRQCFALFTEGKVTVNNKKCEDFKSKCQATDRVERHTPRGLRHVVVSDHIASATKMVLFHKPIGCVVARHDRFTQTIYDLLPQEFRQHYRYIGRLDNDSSGLLLLTTDGNLVNQLTHPRYHITKTYRVGLNKKLQKDDIDMLSKGADVSSYDDHDIHTDRLRLASISGIGQSTIIVKITEGKKRHIRRLFRHVGYRVRTLERISLGPLSLGSLKPGEYRFLKEEEIDLIRSAIVHASQNT